LDVDVEEDALTFGSGRDEERVEFTGDVEVREGTTRECASELLIDMRVDVEEFI
jgi:hypothetical protein